MEKMHCIAVVLEEGASWSTDLVNRAGGKIYRTYLFDALKRLNVCETSSSYELHPLYTTPLKDDERGSLAMELESHETDAVMYIPCSVLHELPEGSFVDFQEDVIPEGLSRADAFRAMKDYVRGNPILEMPAASPRSVGAIEDQLMSERG
uniref:Uncharacterized protein n=1 Tax=Burkholderia sp. M701 TaxID=326454 RepID=V5YPD1_9BURK|nr:hypothetical protein [Burkholderia sp. M701]BAO18791.1 hypothetical protein [Burkholderia sp. M701]